MKVQELRIGNWVSYPMGGNCQIQSGREIDAFDKNTPSPIPLTPEILEKIGFHKYRYWWTRPNNTFNFEEWTNDELGLYLHVNEHKVGQHIKYLHQLQNLYFALTGTELQINL